MAVPSIHVVRKRRAQPKAEKSSAETPGCVFAGRCAWQLGRLCEEQSPPWQDAAAQHRIRCHIPWTNLLSGRTVVDAVASPNPAASNGEHAR
jgi:peptide/nickel transport system ATP-binding protein